MNAIPPFRSIVETHGAQIFKLAFRMVGNEHDAEEVVQETFLKAYRNLESFDGASKLSTWLYRITSNTAVDLLRRRKRHEAREVAADGDQIAGDVRGQDQQLQARQRMDQIGRQLDQLGPKERTAFVLRHMEERSIAEISQIMGIAENAVKHAIFRAVRKLRERLDQGVAS